MVDILNKGISDLQNGLNTVVSNGINSINNLSTTEVAIGSAITGAIVGGVAVGAVTAIKKRKKAKSKTSKKNIKRKSKRKLKFGSKAYRKKYLGKHRRHKQKQPHTAGKRRDTSHKRIRYTKNNQPYIILSNGRARFIKKSSAKSSKKRKGGRY
jgi:ribulose kinase